VPVAKETREAYLDHLDAALEEAVAQHHGARAIVVTGNSSPPAHPLPQGVEWQSGTEWLRG